MKNTYENLPMPQMPIGVKQFQNHRSKRVGHWHEEIELLYFTEGSAIISCNLREYKVQKGDIVVVNGKELHSGNLANLTSTYYCIHVNTAFFDNRIGNEYVIFDTLIRDADCSALLDEVIRRSQERGFANEIEIKRLMYSFFSRLSQTAVRAVLAESDYQREFKKLDTFNRIVEYVEKHYGEEMNVSLLADRFYMSTSYFAHFFKQKAKKSVIQYINEVRIAHAKSFLEREEMSVGEIADRCGFGDFNYFSRKFKAIEGMSPTAYKRQCDERASTLGSITVTE